MANAGLAAWGVRRLGMTMNQAFVIFTLAGLFNCGNLRRGGIGPDGSAVAGGAPALGSDGATGSWDEDLTGWVNPFVGTATTDGQDDNGFNAGNTFPGAAFPFGMVQFSPDTTRAAGGYRYVDSSINAFSLTHFSGRGIQCWLDFGILPTVGPIATSPGSDWNSLASPFQHARESAAPGRYEVVLDAHGIASELTVTPHTGMARFNFVAGDAPAILINAGHSAQDDAPAGTSISIDGTTKVSGSAQSGNCGGGFQYQVFFAAEFDQPFASAGTWNGGTLSPGGSQASGGTVGAVLAFAPSARPIQMRVGLSFVDVAGARNNLAAENSGWDWDAVAAVASSAWNARLHSIEVQAGTAQERTMFYTALYHTSFHPNRFSDVDGRYLGLDHALHTAPAGHMHYENFPGWDNYRSEMPLLSLTAPAQAADMMASLVDMARQDPGGGLPRWQQAAGNSGGMVGDSQDAVIASAYAFGVRGFDAQAALAAMDHGASDVKASSGGHATREGLADYLSLGYLSSEQGGSASITLEYAVDDFAVAQLAHALGQADMRDRYLARAGNWKNLWSTSAGAIAPRSRRGQFQIVDANSTDGFVEGSAEQYLWMVPHDMGGLVLALGGAAPTVQRLDRFFEKLNDGTDSAHAYIGNEPGENAPWAYDFAQTPYRTQDVVRRILGELFRTTPDGIPGNDDAGALSSWAVFASVGLFPGIPGVGGFLVGSPLFPSATVHLAKGAQLVIHAPDASLLNRYVHELRLNGAAHNRPWVSWEEVKDGGTLDFVLSSAPDPTWGAATTDAPPSLD